MVRLCFELPVSVMGASSITLGTRVMVVMIEVQLVASLQHYPGRQPSNDAMEDGRTPQIH